MQLSIRSQIPGRVRWEIPQLLNAPEVASRVQRVLSRQSGIHQVEANPLTGRVLILHDLEVGIETLRVLLERVIGASIRAVQRVMVRRNVHANGTVHTPAPQPAQRFGFGSLIVASLSALALLWGAGLATSPVLVGLGLASATVGAVVGIAGLRKHLSGPTESGYGNEGDSVFHRLKVGLNSFRWPVIFASALA